MEINPNEIPHSSVYKLLVGSVLPRPIGWISSLDEHGRANLAPFSFFNVVCPKPPTIVFCPLIRGTDGKTKDTLNNIRATKEFVVNIVTENLAQAMNLSSIEGPPEMDEFAYAGVTPSPSARVRPPRVQESPVHFECRLREVVEISSAPGGGSISWNYLKNRVTFPWFGNSQWLANVWIDKNDATHSGRPG